MPRRFTDTEKWKDEWWGSLDNDHRMIWLYLVDSCSIAGIWKKDFRGLNFNCNTNIHEEQFIKLFGSRLIDRGNFFFIPKFLRYQCPKGLNSNKPAIISIVKELENNNLIQTVIESLGNDFLIIKDKGKGKGNGQGQGKGQVEILPEVFSDWERWGKLIVDNNDAQWQAMRGRPVSENEMNIFLSVAIRCGWKLTSQSAFRISLKGFKPKDYEKEKITVYTKPRAFGEGQ